MTDHRIEKLAKWLDVESVTGNEAAYLTLLEHELTERGYQCERQKVAANRWNLIARADPQTDLIYCTHVDTVPPHLPVRQTDDRIYGRGACDTKGGILAMIEAAEQLRSEGAQNLGFLFVVGEEVDHCGAKHARKLGLETSQIGLCEPTLNQVVAAQKGMIKIALKADGVAGHSAYPNRGRSAVHKLIDVLHAMRHHQWPTDPVLGDTTLNVGIVGGGVAANVFAPEATAQVLIRTVSETAPLLEQIEQFCEGLHIEIPAFNDPVFFENPEGFADTTVAFNTDATYLAEIAPVWLVGPGDIEHAHSDHEHITFSQLEAGIDLFAKLGRQALS